MKQKNPNLTYALQNDALVHVSQVCSGLKCDCICPSCSSQLVARKGELMAHHFAHHNSDTCKYGYQTSLHLAAKEIIAKAQRIWVPEVKISFNSSKHPELVRPAMDVKIDDVVLEKALGDIIPDILITVGGSKLLVEITVTHPIDKEKLAKIRRLNISTLEIDLSKPRDLVSDHDLAELVTGASPYKRWKYSALGKEYKKRFYQSCQRYRKVLHGRAVHVDGCPISVRTWHGHSYANVSHDCFECRYCIADYPGSANDKYDRGYILCSGRAKIATVQDFSLSLEECEKNFCAEQFRALRAIEGDGCCPCCGSDLKLRSGQYGAFLGCDNFPHCQYTQSIDQETGEIMRRHSALR